MSDYSNTYGGAAKDAANSTILGAAHDTQYDNISTMSATKANKVISATANDILTVSASGDLIDSGHSFTTATFTTISNGNGLLPFPSGTIMLFQQTAAPTGWTKLATHNNKALRVVSGSVGSGGSSTFSTVFGKTATNGHAITTAQMPSHTHTYSKFQSGGTGFSIGAGGTQGGVNNSTTSAGSGNTHSHSMDIRVQYVDVIFASRD